jgi:hypothetical protein
MTPMDEGRRVLHLCGRMVVAVSFAVVRQIANVLAFLFNCDERYPDSAIGSVIGVVGLVRRRDAKHLVLCARITAFVTHASAESWI